MRDGRRVRHLHFFACFIITAFPQVAHSPSDAFGASSLSEGAFYIDPTPLLIPVTPTRGAPFFVQATPKRPGLCAKCTVFVAGEIRGADEHKKAPLCKGS